MGFIKTTGVILHRTRVGEGDAIITILTRELGVITASVKGAENYKNRNSAGAALFAYSEFVLSSGREHYSVRSCLLLESFYSLSTNIERIAFATYAADLVGFTVRENAGDESVLPLVLNTLYLFANSDKSMRLIKCVFELKLLCRMGLTPQLDACVVCGKQEDLRAVSAKRGGVLCSLHAGGRAVSASCLSAMSYIVSAPDNKAFSFALSESDTALLETVIEDFMKEYVDRDFYSLAYLNKIIGK